MTLPRKKGLFTAALLFIVTGLFAGCAGFEYKQGVGFVPVELREADRAIDRAQQAGKDKECPEQFAEAQRLRDSAYETHLKCNTPEGKRIAGEAKELADSPCPAKVAAAPLDSDGDGVPDNVDKCPGTPAGVAVDSTGCPKDSDGDGVPDYLDKCPGTPGGVAVDKNGCPLDSDGDGVPDYLDKCPDTPKGTAVDADGCPPAAPVTLENIYFDFNKATLTNAARATLNSNIAVMKSNPAMKIRIAGHACAHGPEDYNLRMSELRANAVKEFFINEGGIAPDRMSTIAYGESRLALPEVPTPQNKNDHAAQANRRVEFTVTGQ